MAQKETSETVPVAETPPPRAMEPAEASQTPVVSGEKLPTVPAVLTEDEPSNRLGIGILSTIALLALLLKGLSLRRNRPRVERKGRGEPIVVQSPEEPGTIQDESTDSTESEVSPARADGSTVWVAFGRAARVGRWNIAGPAYVGPRLAKSNGAGTENCLIDPSLPVGAIADTAGGLMNYWPSYESMDPQSRHAFLDWMASSRNAPDTYIGYVFVYFYALERRAILERADGAAITKELDRLLAIYGGNRSFRRYGTALQTAIRLLDSAYRSDAPSEFEPFEGDVPPGVKVAVGRRLRDSLPIEPDLLLSLTLSHPDTKVKASVHRSFERLRTLFADECRRRFPDGLVLDGARLSPVKFFYRAASGTFASDFTDAIGPLPDAADCDEALVLGRRILDECTEQLESYAKVVAKAPELASSLAAVALLPPSQRAAALAALPGAPLAWIRTRARNIDPIAAERIFENVAPGAVPKITPAKIRELAKVLAKFGFGVVPDPDFSLIASDEAMLLFELAGAVETAAAASAAYRGTLLTLALGILVGKADGHLQDVERLALEAMVANAQDVTEDERRRLRADLRWLELHPVALGGLRREIASLGTDERSKIADLLVGVASAGGLLDRTEVTILERIYRELNLDPERLYLGLHRATDAAEKDEPVRLPGDGPPVGYAIPSPPAPPSARPVSEPKPTPRTATQPVDRRAAIRAETEAAAVLLAGVFDSTETEELPNATPPEDARALEPRLAGLLRALLERQSWPRVEYERLAREHTLMPGAAIEDINSWSFDEYDDCLLEDGDPIVVNADILAGRFSEAAE